LLLHAAIVQHVTLLQCSDVIEIMIQLLTPL